LAFLVWIANKSKEALLELIKGVGLIFSGKAILPFSRLLEQAL